MKRYLVAAAAVVILLGACASAPEPVEPPDALYDQAKSLRAQIEQYDLAQYARTQYDQGEMAFSQGETQYQEELYAEAETSFSVAVDNYRTVVSAGLRAITAARKSSADDAKGRADSVKASVDLATDYQAAMDVYNEAVAAEQSGDDERAAELYENAQTLFEQVYQAAAERKRLAEEALGTIDKNLEDLDTKRQQLEDEARTDLATAEEEEAE